MEYIKIFLLPVVEIQMKTFGSGLQLDKYFP